MLVVETDASDFALAATLSQAGKPVAFFSRTLNGSERNHSSIEKEAYAIVEAIRKWRHLLLSRPFQLINDQKSVSFMFDNKSRGKIKNDKILRWRLELSPFKYEIIYRPGRDNCAADAISRVCSSITNINLSELHKSLCHPGVTRMYHWLRSRNLPVSVNEVRHMISCCQICSETKPRFVKFQGTLIKSTTPFERLNIDFKGPLPTCTGRPYMLTIVDEFSRFPFAFPCSNMTSSEVIKHLKELFVIFGTPSYIHSDQGASFLSQETKSFLDSLGIATSRTTPYNPRGNGQVERYNGIIWKTINLALRTRGMRTSQWEIVLPEALHSIRSLLCTTTNVTPHERMFIHPRRSPNGVALPTWLATPGHVLLRKMNRTNKYEPLVEEVNLLEANPQYAHVRLPDGRETTVSLRHLAPSSRIPDNPLEETSMSRSTYELPTTLLQTGSDTTVPDACDPVSPKQGPEVQLSPSSSSQENIETLRRVSNRLRRPPAHLQDFVTF